MLDKKTFCALMREFRTLRNDTHAAHEALKKLDPDFGGLNLSRHENFIVGLLERLVDDSEADSMVSYFIYEREWGEKQDSSGKDTGPVTIANKNYKLKTPEHLYDIIVALQKHNQKENADT